MYSTVHEHLNRYYIDISEIDSHYKLAFGDINLFFKLASIDHVLCN